MAKVNSKSGSNLSSHILRLSFAWILTLVFLWSALSLIIKSSCANRFLYYNPFPSRETAYNQCLKDWSVVFPQWRNAN